MAESKTTAQLKQELAELKARLAEQTAATPAPTACPITANEAYKKEPVTIKLVKDNERYRDDVYVSVNDRSYLIKRGVEVTGPRFIEQALKNSLAQDEYVASLVEQLTSDYEKSSRTR